MFKWNRNLLADLIIAWIVALMLLAPSSSPSARAQDQPPVEVIEEAVEAVAQQAVVINDVIAIAPAENRDPAATKKALIADLTPVLHAELYFLFFVSEIEPETKKKIKEAAEKRLDSMDKLLVNENVFGGLGGGFNTSKVIAQTSSGLSLNANPYSKIQEDLLLLAKQHATEAQAAKYEQELSERLAFRRDAVAGMVVQLLDRHLTLSVEQREQIHSNLVQKWDDIENTSIDMYLNNSDYVPVLPFPLIDRVLNRDQRTVWRTLSQYHFPMSIDSNRFVVDWGF